jgi:hypothetical protein
VLIVALGPTKHAMVEMLTAHEPLADLMDVDEVWGINGGVNHYAGRVAYDILWVLDHLRGEEGREPRYGAYLRRWLERFPHSHLITTQADDSWPANVHEYPLGDIANVVTSMGGGPEVVWFRNSIPLIMAYCWFMQIKRVYLFGADYHHETIKRREDDKGNAEAWCHFYRMTGGKLIMPKETTLMDSNKPFSIYGYERQPTFANGVWSAQSYRSSTTAEPETGLPPTSPLAGIELSEEGEARVLRAMGFERRKN